MDTNILTHPDIDPENIALCARLPGELGDIPHDDGGQNEHPAPEAGERPPTSERPRPKLPGALLAGVAGVALAVGGCVFLLSPYNHIYPVPRLASTVRNAAASAGVKLPAVLAPSASLANVTLPPAPPPATQDHYGAKSRQEEVAELLALHPATKEHADGVVPITGPSSVGQPEGAPAPQPPVPANPPTSIPSVANAARSEIPAGYVPSEPGTGVQPVRPRDATAAILAALPSPERPAGGPVPAAPPVPPAAAPTVPAPVPPVSAVSPPADPIAVAHDLRAATMATQDQVQVLSLVTEMASVVKHLREQNAQLRADFGKSSADIAARLADYERRLALAEARSAVTAANEAASPAPAETAAEAAPTVARPVSLTRALALVPAVTGSAAVKSYRVQAASPGLALLAEVERGGGEGAQMQVVVGDTIPDYGRVRSIAQKGTAWIVTTEHGQIQ
jgi:hypothetical protein